MVVARGAAVNLIGVILEAASGVVMTSTVRLEMSLSAPAC